MTAIMTRLSHSLDIQSQIRKVRFRRLRVNMMLDPESELYLRRREQAERAAAKQAVSEVARRVHQELAQKYSERLRRS